MLETRSRIISLLDLIHPQVFLHGVELSGVNSHERDEPRFTCVRRSAVHDLHTIFMFRPGHAPHDEVFGSTSDSEEEIRARVFMGLGEISGADYVLDPQSGLIWRTESSETHREMLTATPDDGYFGASTVEPARDTWARPHLVGPIRQ